MVASGTHQLYENQSVIISPTAEFPQGPGESKPGSEGMSGSFPSDDEFVGGGGGGGWRSGGEGGERWGDLGVRRVTLASS